VVRNSANKVHANSWWGSVACAWRVQIHTAQTGVGWAGGQLTVGMAR
jgi:hypothetical protein